MLNPTVLSRRAPARLWLTLLAIVLAGVSAARAQLTTPYSQIIVFGDSLSDTGNDADVSDDKFGFRVPGPGPGGVINYTDGRFTSGSDTDPAASLHAGVWHEQLAKLFLGMPAAKASLDGGLDYAYGGATTEDGTRTLDFTDNLGIDVNNMGRQVTDYLTTHTADPAALYIVWGGANDLFVADKSALVTTAKKAAKREVALLTKLAQAGAVNFLVPNLPRIGNTPRYNGAPSDIDAYNTACQAFSTRLDKLIPKLEATLAEQGITVNVTRLDVFGLFGRLLVNQQAYNFYNILDESKGESAKADKYLFWDDVHPTTSGHYQLALEAYTALTGRPLVQVAPNFTASGFWLTRSGTDLSAKLVVPYTVGGTAVAGVDYAPLKGRKNIKPDNFAVQVNAPALNKDSAKNKTVALGIAEGDSFGVGTVTAVQIQYGNPITSAEAVNEKPVTKRASVTKPLMLPGSGR